MSASARVGITDDDAGGWVALVGGGPGEPGLITVRGMELLARADVVVAAAGAARLVTSEWIKPGAAVVDVGVSRIVDPETGKARIVGDVDPGGAEVAAWLSPNPGGVGPMTRAMLLANVVDIAERKPCA